MNCHRYCLSSSHVHVPWMPLKDPLAVHVYLESLHALLIATRLFHYIILYSFHCGFCRFTKFRAGSSGLWVDKRDPLCPVSTSSSTTPSASTHRTQLLSSDRLHLHLYHVSIQMFHRRCIPQYLRISHPMGSRSLGKFRLHRLRLGQHSHGHRGRPLEHILRFVREVSSWFQH